MTKHGLSHGLAVITCCITSGVLMRMASDAYPKAINRVEVFLAQHVANLGVDISGQFAAMLLFAGLLATVWGVAFSFLHTDS